MVCGLLALSAPVIEDPEKMAAHASPERPWSASFLSGKVAEGLYVVLRFLCGVGGGS